MSPRTPGGTAIANLEARIAALEAERDRLIVERDAAKSASYRDGETLANLRSELDAVVEDRDEVESDRIRLDAQVKALSAERDAFMVERGVMTAFVPIDQIHALAAHLRTLRQAGSGR